MVVAKQLGFAGGQALETLISLAVVSPLVLVAQVDGKAGDHEDDGDRGTDIECVSWQEVGCVDGEVGPAGDQTPHVAQHDDETDGTSATGVGVLVRTGPTGHECTHGEGTHGDEEGGGVSGVAVGDICADVHAVAHDHEAAGEDEEASSVVELHRQVRQQQDKDGTDKVRWHGEQLQSDRRSTGEERAHNRGQEEGDTLDGDVVEHEAESHGDGRDVEDTAEDLLGAHLVDDLGDGVRVVCLHPRNGDPLLLDGQPASRLDSVGQREESDDAKSDSDDA